jgi:predicted RNA-binding Zn ribbon-like protein
VTYWVEVEGVPQPAKLAGHTALEFCNTWAGWTGGHERDYLESYDHLAVWAGWQDLLDQDVVARLRRRATADVAAANEELVRARLFRASLYRVITSRAGGSAWRAVTAEIEHAAAYAQLVRHRDSRGPIATWHVRELGDLDAPVLAVAHAAGDLLTSSLVERVRSCPGDGCGWLFLDRTGRRVWCSMATCGNRAKVRRFAERKRRARRTST